MPVPLLAANFLIDLQNLYAKHALNAGDSLDFSKGRWLDFDRGIITSTPTVHAALLKAIQEIDEEDKT